MSNPLLNNDNLESFDMINQFEQISAIAESQFDVEEGLLEHNIPTYFVKLREDSKDAFLRLVKQFEPLGFIPILKKREQKVVLQAIPKPIVKPTKKILNVLLLLATVGTVFYAGYLQSPSDILGATMFVGAIMAILGSHEMGHKLLADKHAVEATYPYFIPGLPPIGTFGAVIQQKTLPPNKDALFDIGFAGPISSFILAVIITLIGVQLSGRTSSLPDGAGFLPVPLFFQIIIRMFPPSGTGEWILLHPVAFAGWVGAIITMLNLVPVGMFDGGHVARSVVGKQAHRILSYLGIILLFIIWYPMAFLALFLSFYRHPGPLDDISELTVLRKMAALGLIAVFILCVVPIFPIIG